MSSSIQRLAYIAEYSYDWLADIETETVLFRAPYWSPEISAEWDRLVSERKKGDKKLMGWYSDRNQVRLMCVAI